MTDKEDKHWIQTYMGLKFYPMDGKTDSMSIQDIAHSLSLQCRFTGHCRVFYSVAEHCVRISEAVSPENALWGLLHDATEAYIGDVAKPLKRQLPLYNEAESRLMEVVAKRFGLKMPIPAEVKEMDLRMLATEARDLHRTPPEPWWSLRNTLPLEGRIEPWTPEKAEYKFIQRYKELQVTSDVAEQLDKHRHLLSIINKRDSEIAELKDEIERILSEHMGDIAERVRICGEIEEKLDINRKAADYLWQLLDGIDTLDDSCRDNDVMFRKEVRKTAHRRLKVAVSRDGHIVWKKQ